MKVGILQISLLGDLRLAGADRTAKKLPASKKTRALIGYLIATGQPHRRERLCDLFWEGPNDPRAELRWSLNKIRSLVNDDDAIRLMADRECVAFERRAVDVDVTAIRDLLGAGVAAATTDALARAIELFRGEFLDGLDLWTCYRYQEWCAAEREAMSRLRLDVLSALIDRLGGTPADALPYARALVAADPLSEAGHAAVVRLLGQLGRKKEALGHYDYARRIIETEHGTPPSEELERARVGLRLTGAPKPATARRSPPPPASTAGQTLTRAAEPALPFVGRHVERALIDRLVSATVTGHEHHVLVVTGEPGIGKSLLLEHLRDRVAAGGGWAVGVRAFEAETTRAYGVWIDILRALKNDRGVNAPWHDLESLVPVAGLPASDPSDQSRLFEGVLNLLRHVASAHPLAITLDDLQWIDEASASLLHYVARTFDVPAGLLIACAARSGELDDNAAVAGALRSLARERPPYAIELAPLRADETAELVRAVTPDVDVGRVFAESEGNPLFALGLARLDGNDRLGRRTLDLVIAGQLAPIKDRARDLLMWAAALGRSFTLEVLSRVAGFETPDLLASLDELERRGIIQPVAENTYDFVHDLVRQASYQGISQPRRTLIHRQIARSLVLVAESDDTAAADLARHAALGGDAETAATACAVAGERSLRLFANAEATGFASRGLRHLDQIPSGPGRVQMYMRLMHVRILASAGPGMRPLPPLREEIGASVAAAEALGLHAAATTGHHILSILDQEAGDLERASTNSLRAAQVGRGTEPATAARQLANTARCLLELEADVVQARALLREAEALAMPLGLDLCEMHWARGLVERWRGDHDLAAERLERALALARQGEDRWREYKCLTWLAVVDLERVRPAATTARCAELMQVAGKLGEAHLPFVATLDALARLSADEAGADPRLELAMRDLRAVDDKSYLAYALNAAALIHLRDGRFERAAACAAEALSVAEIMRRDNEQVIARAVLASARSANDKPSAVRQLGHLHQECVEQTWLSMRARAAVHSAARAVGAEFPR
jgi:DNA-binding SARP family transcriptional activator/tetratricopeptide (TPR) repeat protein